MMVVLSHVFGRTPGVRDGWWWSPIGCGGAGGVILFFALSGFLLYLPWLRSHVENRPAPRLRTYALRRCLRIMPAYYVSVVALAVLRVAFGGREPLSIDAMLLHFVFLPTLAGSLQTVYWTLQTEEFFYWLLPALHAFVTRVGAPVLWLTCCAAAAVWLVIGLRWLPHAWLATWLQQTPLFLPAFGLGICTAIIWSGNRTETRATLYVVLGLAGYLLLSPPSRWIAQESDHVLTPLTMLAMAPFASLAVLGAARGGARVLEHPTLRFLGGISFSVYLWHLVVIRVVPVPGAIVDKYWLRVVYTTLATIPVATISFLLIERPFLKLRPN